MRRERIVALVLAAHVAAIAIAVRALERREERRRLPSWVEAARP